MRRREAGDDIYHRVRYRRHRAGPGVVTQSFTAYSGRGFAPKPPRTAGEIARRLRQVDATSCCATAILRRVGAEAADYAAGRRR